MTVEILSPLQLLVVLFVLGKFPETLMVYSGIDSAVNSLHAISKLLYVLFEEFLAAESFKALNLFFNSIIKFYGHLD